MRDSKRTLSIVEAGRPDVVRILESPFTEASPEPESTNVKARS